MGRVNSYVEEPTTGQNFLVNATYPVYVALKI